MPRHRHFTSFARYIISLAACIAAASAMLPAAPEATTDGRDASPALHLEDLVRWHLDASRAEPVDGRWSEDPHAPATYRTVLLREGLELKQERTLLNHRGDTLVRTWLRSGKEAPAKLDEVDFLRCGIAVPRQRKETRYRSLSPRSETWFGSTFWSGPDWTRVGRDWQHPGNETPSVRSFRFDAAGRVEVGGRVSKGDTDGGGGDGVRAIIRLGDREVWRAELGGLDQRGVEPHLQLDVRRGDILRFVVHKRGHYFHDTTRWDPWIRTPDGIEHRASRGFSMEKPAESGWFYELQLASNETQAAAVLEALTQLLDRSDALLEPTVLAEVSSPEHLPLGIVHGGSSESGLAWIVAEGNAEWLVGARRSAVGSSFVVFRARGDGLRLGPARTIELPRLLLLPFTGPPQQGWSRIARQLRGRDERSEGIVTPVREEVESAFQRLDGTAPSSTVGGTEPAGPQRFPAVDLWRLIVDDWNREDGREAVDFSPLQAARHHLQTARLLVEELRALAEATDFLHAERVHWVRLAREASDRTLRLEEARRLYLRARWLRRKIALANPLLDFEKLLYCQRVPTSYSHLVMQYYGWRARPGGGINILEDPGFSLRTREITEDLPGPGNVLEPRLSFDARRVVFSFVRTDGPSLDPALLDNVTDDTFYHVWEVGVDGRGLRQLTRGPYDDVMPTYLPGGDIVFCSTRRGGYARCFGAQFSPRWHVYTLHRISPAGGDLRAISFHDTNEWFPAVLEDGRLLYSRWDYIDRDAVTHQNLWAARPDGSNPVALWGNATSKPHCAFQARPIPGTGKIIFTASAHHSITGGSIAIVDPRLSNNGLGAVTRITPEVPFPEAESRDIREYYSSPWPLSEDYYLVAYSPRPLVWEPGANDRAALGIYLLDSFGRRELLFRDPLLGSTNPIPLRPRPEPPALPAEEASGSPELAEVLLLDVHCGLGELSGVRVKDIRVVEIFPKTTPVANTPPVGLAGEENARAILGTVPVETDGSARFLVPPRTPILFQALDEDGRALQTMRTLTYLQPGEKVSCIGCHEHRQTAPSNRAALAARRPPSRIDPGALGGRPFSFAEMLQPLLDRRCVSCHGGNTTEANLDLRGLPERGFTRSYWSLCGDANFWGEGTNPRNAAEALVPRFGARNQIEVTPVGGRYGARGSRLLRLLRKGHEGTVLAPQELRRLAAWIDLNAIFYGTTDPKEQTQQLRGEPIAMPELR